MGDRFQGKWSGQPLTFTVGWFRLKFFLHHTGPPPVRHVTNAAHMNGMQYFCRRYPGSNSTRCTRKPGTVTIRFEIMARLMMDYCPFKSIIFHLVKDH